MRAIVLRALICLSLGALWAQPAGADVLLTPFAGVTFFDDENRKFTYGATVGFGSLLGVEADVARAELGEVAVGGTPVDLEANLTTAMVNLVVRFPAGPVQPYASGGVGLIRLSGDVNVPFLGSVFSVSGQDFGMNIGGGVYLFPSPNFGIRGDVRYFRTVGDFTVDEITDIGGFDDLPIPDLDFWRVTGGVTLRF